MFRFHIIPTDPPLPSAEIIAHDPAPVLNLVERMQCHQADVEREGAYAFSVRLNDSGMWTIYQRASDTRPDAVTRYG